MIKLAIDNNISTENAKDEIFLILNSHFNAENNLLQTQKEIIQDIIIDNIDKFNSSHRKIRIELIINIISLAVNMMKNNTSKLKIKKQLDAKLNEITEDLKEIIDIDPESDWSKKLQSFQLDDPDKNTYNEPESWRDVMKQIRQSNKQSLIKIANTLEDKNLKYEAEYLKSIIEKY